ncbi:hypothetical protein B0H16DRAFT_1770265 [Mycena metata]|uniref:Uncharacterized protein n=1 Tax=Mycena metata TaxID=1033252 RepID=A0AAD7I0G8_9AGAR|nr:hypothetical protein B0H16DRAFT_1770265 [Mycena metata]
MQVILGSYNIVGVWRVWLGGTRPTQTPPDGKHFADRSYWGDAVRTTVWHIPEARRRTSTVMRSCPVTPVGPEPTLPLLPQVWGLRGLPKAVHQLRRVVATASTEFTALPAALPAVLIACRRRRRHRRLRPQRHCHHGCALPSNRLPHHIAHQQHVPHVTPPLPHITPTPPPAVPTPDLEFLNYYFFSIFSFDVLS